MAFRIATTTRRSRPLMEDECGSGKARSSATTAAGAEPPKCSFDGLVGTSSMRDQVGLTLSTDHRVLTLSTYHRVLNIGEESSPSYSRWLIVGLLIAALSTAAFAAAANQSASASS